LMRIQIDLRIEQCASEFLGICDRVALAIS
jgi:hypothetical protein